MTESTWEKISFAGLTALKSLFGASLILGFLALVGVFGGFFVEIEQIHFVNLLIFLSLIFFGGYYLVNVLLLFFTTYRADSFR